MKNTLVGVGLGAGLAAVVVAVVLALSGGDSDQPTVAQPAVSPPAAVATESQDATGSDTAGNGDSTQGGQAGGASVPTGGSTEAFARTYCEREQRDPDDFQRQFGSGEAGMSNCIQKETNEAARECEAELRSDPSDYQRQFGGSDDAAFERCLAYELQSF